MQNHKELKTTAEKICENLRNLRMILMEIRQDVKKPD